MTARAMSVTRASRHPQVAAGTLRRARGVSPWWCETASGFPGNGQQRPETDGRAVLTRAVARPRVTRSRVRPLSSRGCVAEGAGWPGQCRLEMRCACFAAHRHIWRRAQPRNVRSGVHASCPDPQEPHRPAGRVRPLRRQRRAVRRSRGPDRAAGVTGPNGWCRALPRKRVRGAPASPRTTPGHRRHPADDRPRRGRTGMPFTRTSAAARPIRPSPAPPSTRTAGAISRSSCPCRRGAARPGGRPHRSDRDAHGPRTEVRRPRPDHGTPRRHPPDGTRPGIAPEDHAMGSREGRVTPARSTREKRLSVATTGRSARTTRARPAVHPTDGRPIGSTSARGALHRAASIPRPPSRDGPGTGARRPSARPGKAVTPRSGATVQGGGGCRARRRWPRAPVRRSGC